jgi:hypothetical protein
MADFIFSYIKIHEAKKKPSWSKFINNFSGGRSKQRAEQKEGEGGGRRMGMGKG